MFKTIRQIFQSLKPQANAGGMEINVKGDGIVNFIDIGSVGGLITPWNSQLGLIKFLLNFEPNEKLRKGNNWMTYNTALWERNELRSFYTYKGFNSTGSSLFHQNYGYVRQNWNELRTRGPRELADTWLDRSELISTNTIRCRNLDSVLAEEFPDRPFHFLKIDAQGAELNILRGAENLLTTSCVGLQLELFVLPLYKDIALIDQVEAYLSNFGFNMILKFPPHGSFDSQHDCVFLHKSRDPAIASLVKQVYGLEKSKN